MGLKLRFLFNDLSINGQFEGADAFITQLRLIVDARDRSEVIRNGLLCSRVLSERPATATQTFRSSVQGHSDRDLRQRILRWLSQSGPFWEDDQANVADDLFYFGSEDVTQQGLGEAARRRISGGHDCAFSLPGSGNGCDGDPLTVTQGLIEATISSVSVPNFLSIEDMESASRAALPRPASWVELLEALAQFFDSVEISADVADVLRPHPFSANVADRVFELVGVLDKIVKSRSDRGEFTPATNEIIANFFSGSRARFSDESASNKRDFRSKLTFVHPRQPRIGVFCPFHGKINNPAYRIHFQWPLESDQEKVWIAYIGPKITV